MVPFIISIIAITSLWSVRVVGDVGQCTEPQAVSVKSVTAAVEHGEGPHWDPRSQVLYFVDITSQRIHRYDPLIGTVSSIFIDGGPVSPIVPIRKPGWFIVGRGLDLIRFYWDGVSNKSQHIQVLTSVDTDKQRNRFNDGKSDASGRLWIGTMGPEDPELKPYRGSLYSFTRHNFAPIKQVSDVSISNGLCWNKNDTQMYYIDSPTRNIDVFDFDLLKGTIRNRRTVFNLEKHGIHGVPDGMTIDHKDRLWVAVYGGSAVLHIDPSSETLLRIINFPVSQVTSCTFGGPGFNTMYVTTSRKGLSQQQLAKEPLAGSVFAVSGIQVKGQRKTNSASY